MRSGVVVEILRVDDGVAGKAPTVTFSLKDTKGNAIPLAQMNRVGITLTGPTTDYGATNFGATTAGYYTDSTLTTFSCTSDAPAPTP